MQDERYIILEKYNENESILLREKGNEHFKLTESTGMCFIYMLGIVAGVIGCFIIGPISLVLGFVLPIFLGVQYENSRNKKKYKGTVFEGKYGFGLLNGLRAPFIETCTEIRAINSQKKADYDKVYRVLEKEFAKYK